MSLEETEINLTQRTYENGNTVKSFKRQCTHKLRWRGSDLMFDVVST